MVKTPYKRSQAGGSKREGKKDNSDVATGVNYGVASSSSSSKSIYNPKQGIMRIRGPPKTSASFQR